MNRSPRIIRLPLPDAVMGEPSAVYLFFSVRFSGKAFAKLPLALTPTGRSLCGTGIGYSYPVIEYSEILS